MEKYFKERFPDLTLDEINQLLPDKKGKAGRKFNNRITNIKDWLKDMIKRDYTPQWDLIWRNAFSDVQEKQPENLFERIDQPRRYDITDF